jgi:hypothetical protein
LIFKAFFDQARLVVRIIAEEQALHAPLRRSPFPPRLSTLEITDASLAPEAGATLGQHFLVKDVGDGTGESVPYRKIHTHQADHQDR